MTKNILLICGGQSSEHEVSLRSAKSIYDALDKNKYHVFTVGIQRNGQWRLFENSEDLFKHKNLDNIDDKHAKVLIDYNGNKTLLMNQADNSFSLFDSIDCIFPVLHGPKGEDGTIQGLFEISNIPYVGCNTSASALCMDKALLKDVFSQHHILQSQYLVIYSTDEEAVNKVESTLDYPVFVKPANMGSSVGISKAHNQVEFKKAIQLAFKFDFKIVVESSLENMHEIESSILGNENAESSKALGEIIAGHEFYDYETKYIDSKSQTIIPAELPEKVVNQIRDLALKAYKIAGCSGLARVDLFVDKNNHEKIYINEINTLPGFTSISMYPKIWQAGGLSYSDLLDRLIDLAEQSYLNKKNLSSDYK